MKLNFGKRLLLFFHWLLSLIAFVLLVLKIALPNFVGDIAEFVNAAVGAGVAQILSFVLLGIYALISIFTLILIFSRDKKRSDRGLITVDASEAGKTRVSVAAVEQMIRQAVRGVDGIAEMKCGIVNQDDAISINANVTLVTGAHVPSVTMNMQRAIRGYIELNCGVAVREICVNVNSVESSADGKRAGRKNAAPVAAPAAEMPTEPEPAPAVEPVIEPTAEEILASAEEAPEAEE